MKDVLQQARECGAFVVLDEKGTAYHALMDERELSAFRDSVLEEAAVKVDALRDEHCRMTQMADDKRDHCYAEGGDGCEFVEAWNDAAAAIRSMKGKP